MVQFLKKFLSYLIPDEESNISFLNWLFRLALVSLLLITFLYLITNSLIDTERGKNWGLINNTNNTSLKSFTIADYSRINKDIWLKLKDLRDLYNEEFYFGYVIQYYDIYTDQFVSGLSNNEPLIISWIEPSDGKIINFSGLEEILNKGAARAKEVGFKKNECVIRPIAEEFYPFLRGTFTNFKKNETILNVMYCPIIKRKTSEIFGLTVIYFKKINNYKQLQTVFKSITQKIETDYQSFM